MTLYLAGIATGILICWLVSLRQIWRPWNP